jgi:ComF family protein
VSITPGGVVSRALDAIFPRRCFGCRAFGAYLCEDCVASSERADGERHHATVTVRSVFAYAGAPRSAVLALKFDGVSSAAGEMAAPMADLLAGWVPDVHAVVPVPLGWMRRRTRGYNQSELLAREIARLAGLPLETRALRRRRQTHPQSRQPDREARLANVRDAFALGVRPVSGAVLLVDDVTTTGATLEACARVLLKGGATSVYGLTFARED